MTTEVNYEKCIARLEVAAENIDKFIHLCKQFDIPVAEQMKNAAVRMDTELDRLYRKVARASKRESRKK